MDMAELWEYCLHFEYDRAELVEGLAEWLRRGICDRILDCACGTGFPALDLIGRGFNITCTDGSRCMLAAFQRNAQRTGIDAEASCVLWEDLWRSYAGEFDVVMCRGSSLIYAGAWDSAAWPNPAAIGDALRSFRRCLRPGGRLYVDTTAEQNLMRTEPEHNIWPARRVNGNVVRLAEKVETDHSRRVRVWKTELDVDGTVHHFERRSCYLGHEELRDVLRNAGFSGLRQEKIRGEHYAVFSAIAAADTLAATADQPG